MVTRRGHRLLGSRDVATEGGSKPGLLVPGIVAVATKSPIGLFARGAIGVKDEKKGGSETMEGAAKLTADEMAKELQKIFRQHGWI